MIILNTTKLTEIFILTDDFMKEFAPYCQKKLLGYQPWNKKMSQSEMMTIVIFFHFSGIRCFAWYYRFVIKEHLSSYFPEAYTYENFVAQMKSIQLELYAFLHHQCLGQTTKANYIDSKALKVCHIKREKSHKTFKNIAKKGKTSTGYFFGMKLHLICNQQGEVLKVRLTSGNVSDNNSAFLESFLEGFQGTIYGDKGYLTKLREQLEKNGCKIIAKPKKNMKKRMLNQEQRYFLRKRAIIESVFALMMSQCQIEHTRHRSPLNFVVNLWAGIIAYSMLGKLPKIADFQTKELEQNQIVLL